jgi:uncharacterized repeat protein (TIGR03803 family)
MTLDLSIGNRTTPMTAVRWLRAGMASLLFAAAAQAQAAPDAADSAGHVRTVHSFSFDADPHAGGARPRPPIQASDGNFYGVAYAGGSRDAGTIWRTKPGGATRVLHSFRYSDGYGPAGALVEASDGNLYGVTSHGGSGAGASGTVFRLDASGVLTTLHTFQDPEGGSPEAGLIQASDGNLYGTASGGGQFGDGTIYRLGLDGSFTVMYHFGAGAHDGGRPLAPLMQTRDGHLCGTTYVGGTWNGGTAFCMTLAGEMSFVHMFGGKPGDPNGSTNPLVEGDDGTLYGTSNFGGSQDQGALFTLDLDGNVHVMDLYARPSGGLLKASDGNFYGTAFWGGEFDKGWVYRVTPNRKLTEVHSFSGPEGANPDGELVEGTDGRLYGTTESGGTTDAGVLYSIARRAAP